MKYRLKSDHSVVVEAELEKDKSCSESFFRLDVPERNITYGNVPAWLFELSWEPVPEPIKLVMPVFVDAQLTILGFPIYVFGSALEIKQRKVIECLKQQFTPFQWEQ